MAVLILLRVALRLLGGLETQSERSGGLWGPLRLLVLEALYSLAQLGHLRCELGNQREHVCSYRRGGPCGCWVWRSHWDELSCILWIHMHFRTSPQGKRSAVQVGPLTETGCLLLSRSCSLCPGSAGGRACLCGFRCAI